MAFLHSYAVFIYYNSMYENVPYVTQNSFLIFTH